MSWKTRVAIGHGFNGGAKPVTSPRAFGATSDFTKKLLGGAALAVIACSIAAPALAQAAPPAAPAKADTTTVGAVIVTAERRTTNAQKTAIPVTVFNANELNKRSIFSLNDLQFNTPSMTVQDNGLGALINIRGIGKSDAGQEVPAGTLIYRDGVSVSPGGIFTDEPYYDVSNVEVLRGPQGTFAGDNSTGGAIFVTETDPVLHTYSGWGEASYGNYDDSRVRGALNIPVGDDFALRIATNDEERNSFAHISGPYTGNDGKLREGDWRISALWKPTDHFKAELKVDDIYHEMGGIPEGPYNGSASSLYNISTDTHQLGIERMFRTNLQLTYELPSGVTIKSITGYQFGTAVADEDVDGTANPLLRETYHIRGEEQTQSEEVDILSPNQGRFQWILGGVYQSDLNTQPQPQYLSLAPGGTPTFSVALDSLEYSEWRQDWGVFAQGTYAITPSLKLQVGARYSQSHVTLDDLFIESFFGTALAGQNIVGDTESDSKVTGKVNLEWTLDANNFLYAFVATGHKGGGINGVGIPTAGFPTAPSPPADLPPSFKAEDVTDYEVGWKANWFDNHLRTQVGAFYNDYQNFQVALLSLTTFSGQVENVPGKTQVSGFEAQGQAQFGNLSFNFGGSYLNTALGHFSAIDPNNIGLGFQNLTGREQPNAPKWTAQFGVQYVYDLPGNATLTGRADYAYISSRWSGLFDYFPGNFLPADQLVNAQLVYARPDNWSVTLYGTNLFNLQYAASGTLGTLAIAGPPRQFGVRVMKSF
jgi:iron complex outermembrane recepter protein